MTEQAKLVFINAIHYISHFAGQPAYVENGSMITRDTVRNLMYTLTDEGWGKQQAYSQAMQADRETFVAELRARKEAGGTLSDLEKRIIDMPPMPTLQRNDLLGHTVPDDVRNRFGTDWRAYIQYYEENLPYLYPGKAASGIRLLIADEDARALGLANDDIRLLERCIDMLEKDSMDDAAWRMLYRYTNKRFTSVEDWSSWLRAKRDTMFFTEMGGFKFMAGPDDALGLGEESPVSVSVEDPTATNPVTCAATLSVTSPGFATLGVKLSILPGWYVYAQVPEGQPFEQTSFDIESEQLYPTDIMLIPYPNKQIQQDPFLVGYEGEVMFTQDFFVLGELDDAEVKVVIHFQACNVDLCTQPETREILLSLSD